MMSSKLDMRSDSLAPHERRRARSRGYALAAVEFWKFAHIAAMFAAVSIFVGQGMLEGAVARSGDVRALRRVLAAEDAFTPIGGGIFLLGIAFGVVTALTGGLDLTEPWLIAGYVLTAVILILAFAYHAPTSNRLKALAAASADDAPSKELRAAMDAPIGRVVNVLDGLVWLGVIFVMVVKPFS
jgi:hypothetical protein